MIKKTLVFIWNKMFDIYIEVKNNIYLLFDYFHKKFVTSPNIISIDSTIQEIINKKLSVSRYGDGEFKLANGIDISFQKSDIILQSRLKSILKVKDDGFLVCIPDIFNDLSIYTEEPKNYWKLHIAKYRRQWYELLDKNNVYGNSFISRCYYQYKDKSHCKNTFKDLKRIWDNRQIVLIEGKKSRLGIGNDLFDNVVSIERLLVPEINAYDKYNEILEKAKKIDKKKLILLAAGPTATVLAYDLYKIGYQVIDIGHVDIEYEWFLRKATKKIKIENKFVCEAGFGEGVGNLNNKEYQKQIIGIV